MARSDYMVMGIKVSLDPRVVTDAKTLKLFRQILAAAHRQEGEIFSDGDAIKALGIFDLLDRLVGTEQSDYVLDSLADEDGYTPTEKLGEFIGALFEIAAPKNLPGSHPSGAAIQQSCEPTSSSPTI